MVMQVRRTLSIGAVPTGLSEGQISVGMADQPPTAWVGVPISVNPAGVIPITGLVRTVAGAPQPAGALGQLWWDEDAAQLFVYTGSEWVVAVNPPIPDTSSFLTAPASDGVFYGMQNGVWSPLTEPGGGVISDIVFQQWVLSGTYTYTPSPGMVRCVIECVGGGGGGAGCGASTAGNVTMGSGGGGGGYARKVATATDIGASQTVIVGAGGANGPGTFNGHGAAGGTTSVGALCWAQGGRGGISAGAAGPNLMMLGGLGGSASPPDTSGDYGTGGAQGGWGVGVAGGYVCGGQGGSSALGGGAANQYGTGNGAGGLSGGRGAGGSGASSSGGNANFGGGGGGAGVVLITEYCQTV